MPSEGISCPLSDFNSLPSAGNRDGRTQPTWAASEKCRTVSAADAVTTYLPPSEVTLRKVNIRLRPGGDSLPLDF